MAEAVRKVLGGSDVSKSQWQDRCHLRQVGVCVFKKLWAASSLIFKPSKDTPTQTGLTSPSHLTGGGLECAEPTGDV